MAVNKIFIPTLISSITYEPVRTLPHIYFYNGLKESEPYFIQHYPSGSTSSVVVSEQNAFPYVDYYDGLTPSTSSNSLLFFNEQAVYGETPTASLYSEYWDTYVSLLYNPRTRLFKASAIIPLADYFEMELNDIVQWRGNYYHLRAINDYNLKDGTCNIELLGPIIRDAVGGVEPPTPEIDCTFDFSSSFEGNVTTTTTSTTTTAAPTTTTTTSTTTTTTSTSTSTTTTTTGAPISITYLMVAGGGAGGAYRHAGGGGGGGMLSGSATITTGTYPIVVGAGGVGSDVYGTAPSNGNDTTFNSLTSIGGGGGNGSAETLSGSGSLGGSGGGGAPNAGGGLGTSGQGNKGGNGIISGSNPGLFAGGGGGGKGAEGSNASVTAVAGNGGSGSIFVNATGGGNTYYAGGGGGGRLDGGTGTAGTGGIGGGGDGSRNSLSGISGTANTGGGGGGAGSQTFGGNGGSGIVIIYYSGSARGTGGSVTTANGFTSHTFTSSGNLIITS